MVRDHRPVLGLWLRLVLAAEAEDLAPVLSRIVAQRVDRVRSRGLEIIARAERERERRKKMITLKSGFLKKNKDIN